MKIDRAMYFIYTTVNKTNNALPSLARRFFTYWKLQNLYGIPTRDLQADSVTVDNLNAVSIEGDEPDIDDLDEVFNDTISEQASEMEWYTQNISSEVSWDNVECDLVEPCDDDTVSYLYEKGLAYESRDISEFVDEQIACINENNEGMTPDAYVNFMLGELKAQMDRRNTPVVDPDMGPGS
mgnify:CR=1 FL=1